MERPAFDYDRDGSPPYRFVAVEPTGNGVLPPEIASRILVDTVHDGSSIPRTYRFHEDGSPRIDPAELDRRFVRERDWGANLVAHKLAQALGLPGYHRVEIARVLLDFNRFPGSTPDSVHDPLARLAINPPFTHALDFRRKADLLEDYYDRISELTEQAIGGKLIKIAVHTYDEHNPSLTQRPDVSVISRPAFYQQESRMPFGIFDPLYPDVLGESMCSRTLLLRISLNLERAGFRVGHNHPYLLPEGSLEMRTQVWYFFRYLRTRFEEAFPETREQPDFERVWELLLNTNLRTAESDSLGGYLHRYRRVRGEKRERFRAARQAYEQVQSFLESSTVIADYRSSPGRPSSVAFEVRKDLLCRFDPETGFPLPIEPRTVRIATAIAQAFAEAIVIHFDTDRTHPVGAPIHG